MRKLRESKAGGLMRSVLARQLQVVDSDFLKLCKIKSSI